MTDRVYTKRSAGNSLNIHYKSHLGLCGLMRECLSVINSDPLAMFGLHSLSMTFCNMFQNIMTKNGCWSKLLNKFDQICLGNVTYNKVIGKDSETQDENPGIP